MATATEITVGQDAVRPQRSPLPTSAKQDAVRPQRSPLLYIRPILVLEDMPKIMATASKIDL